MDRSEGIKRAVTFTVAVLAVTWLAALVFYVLGGRIHSRLWFGLFAVLYMWFPALVTIVLQKRVYREGVIGPLDVSFRVNRWWFIGWVTPPIAVCLTFALSLAMAGASLSPDMSGLVERVQAGFTPEQAEQFEKSIEALPPYFGWLAFVLGMVPSMIAGATINAVAAFGEELGWRGFLQRALGFLGFWKASFVIGVIWGIWHAPLIIQGFNYPQHPRLGVLMMVLLTVMLAPVFAYFRFRGGSVIVAAIMHGTFNAVAGLAILLLRGGSDLTVGVTGLAGLISLALINLGILIYERRTPAAVTLPG